MAWPAVTPEFWFPTWSWLVATGVLTWLKQRFPVLGFQTLSTFGALTSVLTSLLVSVFSFAFAVSSDLNNEWNYSCMFWGICGEWKVGKSDWDRSGWGNSQFKRNLLFFFKIMLKAHIGKALKSPLEVGFDVLFFFNAALKIYGQAWMGGKFGRIGCMYMYGWVPLLLTWN